MDVIDARIRSAVQAEGGRVTLARFMELALTAPDAGYYVRDHRILGEGSVTGENLPSVSYTACSTGRKDTLMMGFLYSSISSDTRLIYVNSISSASLSGGSTVSAADLLSLMITFTTCLILSGTSTNPTTPSTITASTSSLRTTVSTTF